MSVCSNIGILREISCYGSIFSIVFCICHLWFFTWDQEVLGGRGVLEGVFLEAPEAPHLHD